MLTSVMYELATACPKCKNPLPLNGLTESVLCASCQSPVPTPEGLWETVLADMTGESLAMEEKSGRNTTMMLGEYGHTIKGTYGRLAARCEPDCKTTYPQEDLARLVAQGGGQLFCGQCGKGARVRPVPTWFRERVHPAAVALVGESQGADEATAADPKDVRFHCYHCGAAMPLDGKERAVTCGFCQNDLVVPDAIWIRLHPVKKVGRWFALLAVGSGTRALPESMWEFCDFTVDVAGRMVVAWHDDDEGDVGHRCRVGAVNGMGMLDWVQDGVLFEDETELLVSPHDGAIVLVDREGGAVRLLDGRDGGLVRTLPSPEEDSPSAPVSVREARGVAVDWHGDLVVHREWSDTGERALRRFGPDGARKPLWPGARGAPDESRRVDSVRDLRDQPCVVPYSAKIGFGWDGAFYVVGEDLGAIARFDGSGRRIGLLEPDVDYVEDLRAFAVAGDGTLYALVEHETPLRDEQWAHVVKVHPDGRAELWLGPHAADEPVIGQHDERLEVHPDGRLFVGDEVDSLRIVGPDRRVLFKTNATRSHERAHLLEHLAKLRRGRRLAEDRG